MRELFFHFTKSEIFLLKFKTAHFKETKLKVNLFKLFQLKSWEESFTYKDFQDIHYLNL
jgi:hypothetical protein